MSGGTARTVRRACCLRVRAVLPDRDVPLTVRTGRREKRVRPRSGAHLVGARPDRYGPAVSIRRGDVAPDFTLPGISPEGRGEFGLSARRGRPVVLVFYPGDNTPVCTEQLTTYTEEIHRFADVGAEVLAISPQSVDSHAEFSCSNGGFAFPLLADETREVGETYGIIGPL